MVDNVNGLPAPGPNDPFNPNGDIKNLRDATAAALPFARVTLTLSAGQPGPVSLGTPTEAYYVQVGKKIKVKIDVPITAAGVAGNALRIYAPGLPTPATAPVRGCGTWWYFDVGSNNRMGICQLNTDDGNYFTGWVDNAGSGVQQFGQAPSIAAANGDRVVISAEYWAA